LALAAEMLVLAGQADGVTAGRARAAAALDDGRGLEKLREVVEAQGGDAAALDDPGRLPTAPVRTAVEAERSGRVLAMDTRAIGEAAVSLGAGRRSLEDGIDPRVGFVVSVSPGTEVRVGEPLATVHAADDAGAAEAAAALRAAITIGEGDPAVRPLVSHRVTRSGTERLD
ncbi:MAG: thymidine phosphorylase, partial [Gemmatimonadota bacterium]